MSAAVETPPAPGGLRGARDSAVSINIQQLRGVAAFGIVAHHVLDALDNHLAPGWTAWNPVIGTFGIDLFFVISGYVMAMSVDRRDPSVRRFLFDRITRIVPLYWLLTFAACIPLLLGMKIFANKIFSADHLLRSLLFLPPLTPGDSPFPILFVGWTLNYEMGFYLLFALAIGVLPGRLRKGAVVFGLSAACLAHALSNGALLPSAGDPIVAGFALGILVWEAQSRAWIDRLAGLPVLLAGACGFVLIDMADVDVHSSARLGVSACAAAIVAGAVALERSGTLLWADQLKRLGDASYALYLAHPFVLQVVGKLALVGGLTATTGGIALSILIMIAASIACGFFVHEWVEKPLTARLRAAGKTLRLA